MLKGIHSNVKGLVKATLPEENFKINWREKRQR